MPSLVIDRRRPGKGYRHVVRKQDVRRFIDLLPKWEQLSEGLNAIVLDCGNDDLLGWHRRGVVAICGWEREIVWDNCSRDFYEEHKGVFWKLGIPTEIGSGFVYVGFTEATAKAFLLVHVLVHELGHHHDRMTTRSRRQASRGESYAEAYARRHEDAIIEQYQRTFDS